MPPDSNTWISVHDAAELLHTHANQIHLMIEQGTLLGIRLPNGPYRVMHPGEQYIEFIREADKRHIEHVPFLSALEVAELLGIDRQTVNRHVMEGALQATKLGVLNYFTVAEFRRFLFQREQKLRRGREYFSQRIVQWVRKRMAEIDSDLDRLIDDVMALKEPERSLRLEELIAATERLRPLVEKLSESTRDAAPSSEVSRSSALRSEEQSPR